jgi:flagellar biosynthesis component FlhA
MLVIPVICAVVLGEIGWLLSRWPGGWVGTVMTVGLIVAAFMALRFTQFERRKVDQVQADDQEQETAQPEQVQETAQTEMDAIDRQILSVAIAHPEYTDAEIQQALTVSTAVETVRKKRNLFWGQGSPVFNAESLKRRRFKKDLHN